MTALSTRSTTVASRCTTTHGAHAGNHAGSGLATPKIHDERNCPLASMPVVKNGLLAANSSYHGTMPRPFHRALFSHRATQNGTNP
jgi:hypothetical protein